MLIKRSYKTCRDRVATSSLPVSISVSMACPSKLRTKHNSRPRSSSNRTMLIIENAAAVNPTSSQLGAQMTAAVWQGDIYDCIANWFIPMVQQWTLSGSYQFIYPRQISFISFKFVTYASESSWLVVTSSWQCSHCFPFCKLELLVYKNLPDSS